MTQDPRGQGYSLRQECFLTNFTHDAGEKKNDPKECIAFTDIW